MGSPDSSTSDPVFIGGTVRAWKPPSVPPPAAPQKRTIPPPRSSARSRARLSLVLLSYFLGVVMVVVLAPFQFSGSPAFRLLNAGEWHSGVTSALFFVPLGFLYPLTRRGRALSELQVALLGLVVAAAMQMARSFELGQAASVADILFAGVGAGVGALLVDTMNRRLLTNPRIAHRLSLELPLVALIYLLVPLLFAASVSAGDDPLRMIALLPLALLGARLISSVQEHHFAPAGVFRARAIAAIGAGWAVLGLFPAVRQDPVVGIGLVLLVALAAAHESSIPAVRGGGVERRFEGEVLRSAMPYVVVYFLTAAFLPLALGLGDWHVAAGLTGSGDDRARQLMRLLEPLTALVVLGYMLAEARGRRELPFRATAARIAAECACVAIVIEVSRGFQRGTGASVLQLALMIGASVLGAGIYHQQRERVRWILIQRPHPAAPPLTMVERISA